MNECKGVLKYCEPIENTFDHRKAYIYKKK